MKLFKIAQMELVSSAPGPFILPSPPSIGWWRAKFSLSLPSAVLVHYYQSTLGTMAFENCGANWQAGTAAKWQANAGLSPKQWTASKNELGPSGVSLLTFAIRGLAGTKATWIRPTDSLLAVFGLTATVYDAVTGLDRRLFRQISPFKKHETPAVVEPLSEKERDALASWNSAGGLARLRSAKMLGTFLERSSATNPSSLTATRSA